MVDPLVGGLPDDNPDPERQVGGHQVDESKSREQSKSLHDDGGVDEQDVHLKESEQSLRRIYESCLCIGVGRPGGWDER